jgi:cobalt-zinc-cadmium efflux system outer membrane protein
MKRMRPSWRLPSVLPRLRAAGVFAAAVILPCWALPAEVPPADLPPVQAVQAALDNHPTVRAARADLAASQADHLRLRAGGYEYGLRLMSQRRNVSGGPDYTEWQAGVERGFRLPGKSRLDDRIGAAAVGEAEERVGDARHETARKILGLWYRALQAEAAHALWREEVGLLEAQRTIVEKRVKQGDAARLDGLQADAALAQARSQAGLAQARLQTALAELKARFPELPAPADEGAEPAMPAGGMADWIGHTLEHNHELLAIRRAVERARLLTRRAEADRLPDPTLGLHLAHEQGNERLVGISVAISLPGEGRRAQARVYRNQAESLAEQEDGVRRRLSAEASANWQRAASGVESYGRLRDAAQAVSRHADLARRAYELGELGLAETLIARRNALDAAMAASQARLGGNEAVARLLLDAHRLWSPGSDEEHR